MATTKLCSSAEGMTFISAPALFNRSSFRPKRRTICAQYLPPEFLNIQFDSLAASGSFGGVFFGEYRDPNDPSNLFNIVVKCPVETDIGRKLYNMEKYTNLKLQQKADNQTRFPPFLGEMIIPPGSNLAAKFVRLGLVWQRVGNGETLEDFLSSYRIMQLANLLGTVGLASPLRRQLCAKIILELSLLLRDLQQCGIVHR